MTSVVELIVSISLLAGAGYFGVHELMKVEGIAKLRIQKGLPHLSPFATKLTGLSYDKNGELRQTRPLTDP